MSHTSPQSYLVWALLSTLLGCFLIFHLWRFDKFKCLRWSSSQSGAFKRVMTYSYLLSVPLIISYSVGFTIIKYEEGYIDFPMMGIIPSPPELWSSKHQKAILPLYLCIAFAWALEMVTHLEELCFWLFVVNAGAVQRDWFKSRYFKTWAVGSLIAVLYMPLVVIFTRSDPLRCEAYTFLAGSLGSLTLTFWFLPVLWMFPSFLKHLEREGVDGPTIVRLTKFHELNAIRVLFRFLFAAPLFILAVDGVRPHQHINESLLGTDLLAMISGFGVVISSGLTLVIFFPRSIDAEIKARRKARKNTSPTPFTQQYPDDSAAREHEPSREQGHGHYQTALSRSQEELQIRLARSESVRRMDDVVPKYEDHEEDTKDRAMFLQEPNSLPYRDHGAGRVRDLEAQDLAEDHPPAFSELGIDLPGINERHGHRALPPLNTTELQNGTRRNGTVRSARGFGRRANPNEKGDRDRDRDGGESFHSNFGGPGGPNESRERLEIRINVDDSRTLNSAEGDSDPFGSPTLTLPSYTLTAPRHSFSNAHLHLQHPVPASSTTAALMYSSNPNHQHTLGLGEREPPPPNPFSSSNGTMPITTKVAVPPPLPPDLPNVLQYSAPLRSPSYSSPGATISSPVTLTHSHSHPHPHSPSNPSPRVAPLKLEPNRRPRELQDKIKTKSSMDRLLMRKTSSKAATKSSSRDGNGTVGVSPADVEIEMQETPTSATFNHNYSSTSRRTMDRKDSTQSMLTSDNLERHNNPSSSSSLVRLDLTSGEVASGSGSGSRPGSGGGMKTPTKRPLSPLVPNRRQSQFTAAQQSAIVNATASGSGSGHGSGTSTPREMRPGLGLAMAGFSQGQGQGSGRESKHFVAGFKSPIDMGRGDSSSDDS